MANGHIRDSQLTASSEYHSSLGAIYGRLNLTTVNGKGIGGWEKDNDDTRPWLQVDFKKSPLVNQISTQGQATTDHWVTSYSISYSNDKINFQFYEEEGKAKVDKMCLLSLVKSIT